MAGSLRHVRRRVEIERLLQIMDCLGLFSGRPPRLLPRDKKAPRHASRRRAPSRSAGQLRRIDHSRRAPKRRRQGSRHRGDSPSPSGQCEALPEVGGRDLRSRRSIPSWRCPAGQFGRVPHAQILHTLLPLQPAFQRARKPAPQEGGLTGWESFDCAFPATRPPRDNGVGPGGPRPILPATGSNRETPSALAREALRPHRARPACRWSRAILVKIQAISSVSSGGVCWSALLKKSKAPSMSPQSCRRAAPVR